VVRGPSYAYPQLPVTEADKRAFVKTFLQSSPMSGKGPEGGLGHTPAEYQSDEEVGRMVRTNEFADRHPYFRPGGVWVTPEGDLWVERSVAAGAAPVLDGFDREGRLLRQVILPEGRRVVGMGRGVLYAVAKDADELEVLPLRIMLDRQAPIVQVLPRRSTALRSALARPSVFTWASASWS
jgi:hypothetical protein